MVNVIVSFQIFFVTIDFAKTKAFRDGGHAGKQRYHKS